METMKIEVALPKNRDQTGMMLVWVGGCITDIFSVLGRGSRGGGDTQMLRKGNTPIGTYDGGEWAETKAWSQKSYGPHGAVRLRPLSGNAMMAASLGRSGILIHGGDPGAPDYWGGNGALRATHGCLRLRNADMKRLSTLHKEHAPKPRKAGAAITVTDVLAAVRVDITEY